MKKNVIALCVTAALCGCNSKKSDVDERADALYDNMSQEERVMQLRSANGISIRATTVSR